MMAHSHQHHGQRFTEVNRLRSPERLAWLEVDHVASLALEGINIQSVLDVGTGTGIFAEAFEKRGKTVTGVDVNPEMLEAARGFVPQGTFKPAAAENLPFSADDFDLVFMGLVLHETDDLQKALAEANRVTRTRLAILEWPYEQQEIGPGMQERLPSDQLMQLAIQAGFTGGEAIRLKQLVLYRFTKAENHDQK